jgi:hypothetical protein
MTFTPAAALGIFYDVPGKALVRFHRLMGALRRESRALRNRGFFFYFFDQNHLRHGVLAYRREAPAEGALPAESPIVVLNFSDRDAKAWIQFPTPAFGRSRSTARARRVVTSHRITVFFTITATERAGLRSIATGSPGRLEHNIDCMQVCASARLYFTQ